jgi:hypothetical protein
VVENLPVLLMVIFMVAAIHFLKNLLLWIFTHILLKIKSKVREPNPSSINSTSSHCSSSRNYDDFTDPIFAAPFRWRCQCSAFSAQPCCRPFWTR